MSKLRNMRVIEIPRFRAVSSGPDTLDGLFGPESGMCNMPNPDGAADKILGISQQQIFLPLKTKKAN